VSDFPKKHFEGAVYEFGHLKPFTTQVPLSADGEKVIDLHVTFGCHCFTDGFSPLLHQDHHRYVFKNEVRAFSVERHECSLQLPAIIQGMFGGRIYHADASYTYVAHITLASKTGPQQYSLFFSLEKDMAAAEPALKMFVKSAYLRTLVIKSANAQSWRFVSLAGQLAGAFPPKEKKPRPQKKKAP
jgi:hypothetical protein